MVLNDITVTRKNRRVFMISNDAIKIICVTVGVIMSLFLPFLIYHKVMEGEEVIDKDDEK